jgi:hypothetical protein
MKIKIALLFLVMTHSLAHGQSAGAMSGGYGSDKMPPDKPQWESKGAKEKSPDRCIKEGGSIPVIPNAPDCCAGLIRIPPKPDIVGSAGICVKQMQEACVEVGRSIVIAPNAPKVCCSGLKLIPPPPGRLGSRGTCVDVSRPCLQNGQRFVDLPRAPRCCDGLIIKKRMDENNRPVLFCAQAKCVAEGDSLIVHPAAPRVCCPGLQLQPAEPGVVGTRGICVQQAHPVPVSIDSSERQVKKEVESKFVGKKKASSSKVRKE